MSDTSAESAASQVESFRKRTPEQRVRIALEMSESVRQKTLADLRRQHPELSERQLIRELVRLWYGIELPSYFDGIV